MVPRLAIRSPHICCTTEDCRRLLFVPEPKAEPNCYSRVTQMGMCLTRYMVSTTRLEIDKIGTGYRLDIADYASWDCGETQ